LAILNILYYRFYLITRTLRTNEDPEENSIFILGIFSLWNLISLYLLIRYSFGIQLSTFKLFVIFMSWVLFLYLYLRSRYEKIISRYEKSTNKAKANHLLIFILYLFLTVITSYYAVQNFG